MDDFDKKFNRTFKGVIIANIVGALLSIAAVAVAIWAIIKIVNHFTV